MRKMLYKISKHATLYAMADITVSPASVQSISNSNLKSFLSNTSWCISTQKKAGPVLTE